MGGGFGVTPGAGVSRRSNILPNLETALCRSVAAGEPNVGLNLDLFHYYTGPSKFEDLLPALSANLAFVQVCDLAGTPRELATDADRVLPGEG